MVNPHRAEAELKLAGETYKAKMSLDSIIRVEKKMGMSILKVAQNLSQGNLTTEQIIGILTVAIRSGGKDVTDKEVKQIVEDAGLIASLSACEKSLVAALGDATSGNEEEAESE
jgi:hypothetical protein